MQLFWSFTGVVMRLACWVIGLVALVYIPFLHLRQIRPAGDEKVYISQSIEMAEAGNWFLQRLGDEPNYYKGPFHYLGLRLGHELFGWHPYANFYLNVLMVMIAGVMLAVLLRRYTNDAWAFAGASAFALSGGLFPYVLSSQMEAELTALYAIALVLLVGSEKRERDRWAYWIVAGIAAWVKSPVHSVLLAASVLGFWTWRGLIWSMLRSPRFWLQCGVGVAVGVAGYLPIVAHDWQPFYETYLLRENFGKPGNSEPWHKALMPILTYHVFPWTFAIIASLATLLRRRGIGRCWSYLYDSERMLLQACFFLAMPTVVFFTYHPFRSDLYTLPIVSAVLVAAVFLGFVFRAEIRMPISIGMRLSVCLMALVPAGVCFVWWRIGHQASWWPDWVLPITLALFGLGFWRIWVSTAVAQPLLPARIVAGYVPVLLGFQMVFALIGEAELRDIRKYRDVNTIEYFGYYNLQKDIWSEWGHLSYWLRTPVRGIHSEQKLFDHLQVGVPVIVKEEEDLRYVRDMAVMYWPELDLEVTPWRRWRTRREGFGDRPLANRLLEAKDESEFEMNQYIVRIR